MQSTMMTVMSSKMSFDVESVIQPACNSESSMGSATGHGSGQVMSQSSSAPQRQPQLKGILQQFKAGLGTSGGVHGSSSGTGGIQPSSPAGQLPKQPLSPRPRSGQSGSMEVASGLAAESAHVTHVHSTGPGAAAVDAGRSFSTRTEASSVHAVSLDAPPSTSTTKSTPFKPPMLTATVDSGTGIGRAGLWAVAGPVQPQATPPPYDPAAAFAARMQGLSVQTATASRAGSPSTAASGVRNPYARLADITAMAAPSAMLGPAGTAHWPYTSLAGIQVAYMAVGAVAQVERHAAPQASSSSSTGGSGSSSMRSAFAKVASKSSEVQGLSFTSDSPIIIPTFSQSASVVGSSVDTPVHSSLPNISESQALPDDLAQGVPSPSTKTRSKGRRSRCAGASGSGGTSSTNKTSSARTRSSGARTVATATTTSSSGSGGGKPPIPTPTPGGLAPLTQFIVVQHAHEAPAPAAAAKRQELGPAADTQHVLNDAAAGRCFVGEHEAAELVCTGVGVHTEHIALDAAAASGVGPILPQRYNPQQQYVADAPDQPGYALSPCPSGTPKEPHSESPGKRSPASLPILETQRHRLGAQRSEGRDAIGTEGMALSGAAKEMASLQSSVLARQLDIALRLPADSLLSGSTSEPGIAPSSGSAGNGSMHWSQHVAGAENFGLNGNGGPVLGAEVSSSLSDGVSTNKCRACFFSGFLHERLVCTC